MYGVPADLDLERFRGATLMQIALGEYQVQFNFQPYAHIGVEGLWELRDSEQRLIDRAQPNRSVKPTASTCFSVGAWCQPG